MFSGNYPDLVKRLYRLIHVGVLVWLLAICSCGISSTQVDLLDLVLQGGRVMDPETGLDAVRNVGILGGKIIIVTEESIEGREVIDVTGLVVAPGFIDLHAHGQDPISNRLQAADGVTTALELEVGVFPVEKWLKSRQGKALLHYGATVGHTSARIKTMSGLDVPHWPMLAPGDSTLAENKDYAEKQATPKQLAEINEMLMDGLKEGALGLGLGISYTPASTREELVGLFQLASDRDMPIFIHLRDQNTGGILGAFQEAIANAASTGAAVQIVHLNSTAKQLAREALNLIRGAREHGVDITTEAYPYTASSTFIETAQFDLWENLPEKEYQRLQWPSTGERLTSKTFKKYRKQGGFVIIHGRSEETNQWIVSQPDVIVASDGIPFRYGPAHPRGAGTFSRVLGHYVREKKALSLMDGLRKCTLLPALRMQSSSILFRNKGRLQEGKDADITVFDPDSILDLGTYEKGDQPSRGILHVLVMGTFVLRDGAIVENVFPGKALKGKLLAIK
jgi:N-acyl-D-aspartate/D-glutamate deacylase